MPSTNPLNPAINAPAENLALLYQGVLEEALWDAIGKVAGQPVCRLLGGGKTSIPVYITAVWPGPADQ